MTLRIKPEDWTVFDKNKPELWPIDNSICLCQEFDGIFVRKFKRNGGEPYWILESGSKPSKVYPGDKYIVVEYER
jgi:hypothetical protein